MAKNTEPYLAHVRQDDKGQWHIHHLKEHLVETAKLSAEFASPFGMEKAAFVLGLLHDLGKYKSAFQERIKGKSGYDPEAHVTHVDHATAGGIYSNQKLMNHIGEVLAWPILSHHTGLQDKVDLDRRLAEKEHLVQIENQIENIIIEEFRKIEISPKIFRRFGSDKALLIRMLFSALVDADSIDTERFMNPEKSVLRSNQAEHHINDLWTKIVNSLSQYIIELEEKAPATKINELRKKLRLNITTKAELSPGFFSLTVPTGGGKTLTSLLFAAEHARLHNKRRIIYSIPFTSIIEQTADVFRVALSDVPELTILEHHYNLQPEKETAINLLLSENWNAPIIITTNVQLYESLFSNSRKRTRKLHNIVNSVIILDECQTIPPDYINPILALLKELVKNYGVSVVFCTATQIPFEPVKNANIVFHGVEGIRELNEEKEEFFELLKRFNINKLESVIEYEDLAKQINCEIQALAIVNRKADAFKLYSKLIEPKAHLSTWMCPTHRRNELNKIKEALKNGNSMRVVSTQLIEAGVDIDFPVVYRATAGLDSIVQAGGRCNREGKLNELGRLIIFQPPKAKLPSYIQTTSELGRNCLRSINEEIKLDDLQKYFEQLFWRRSGPDGGELDRFQILKESSKLNWQTVNDLFRIIDDHSVPVLMPYKEGKDIISQILSNQFKAWTRTEWQRIQLYSVAIPRYYFTILKENKAIDTINDTIHVLVREALYNNDTGFDISKIDNYDVEELII